jgi:hypothetical protein
MKNPKKRSLVSLLSFAFFVLLMFTACAPSVSNDIEDNDNGQDEIEELPGLSGTSWEWSGVKLELSETNITMNGGTSCSYSYDKETREGTASALGAFTVSEDFLQLVFPSFMGGGEAVFGNSAAAIIGTKWRLNQGLLEFRPAKVKLHRIEYDYSFDAASKKGAVTAQWGKPGAFSVSEDGNSITFSDYRDSGLTVVFTKVTEGGPSVNDASLLGSDWWWDGTSLHLDFITENTTLLWSISGYYEPPILFDYRYNTGTKTGGIVNGRNSVGTKYDLGDFSISGNVLNFVQYGPYPHGAVFYNQE